jgi:hypothetical protein
MVHFGNNTAILGVNKTTYSTDTNIVDVMIGNALNINSAVSTEDNTHVLSSNTTISTLGNK